MEHDQCHGIHTGHSCEAIVENAAQPHVEQCDVAYLSCSDWLLIALAYRPGPPVSHQCATRFISRVARDKCPF